MIGDVTELWGKCNNIAFKRHPIRTCYVDEGEACKRLNKAEKSLIERQINEYISCGLPTKSGMVETGIILRKYNNDVVGFCEAWQSEIDKHTHRDQLSIMKALFDIKIEYSIFEVEDFRKYITIEQHK